MSYEEHPELSGKYPAIDGIEKTSLNEEAIRPDIERILQMDSPEFELWYRPKIEATQRQLDDFRLIREIPELRYGGGEFTLTAHTVFRDLVETLEKGDDYLDKIKTARDEYQSTK